MHDHFSSFFKLHLKNGPVNLKKMMKNDEKKCHLKNDKVEHALLYHFLNYENHTQIVPPGKKTYSTGCAKT